MALKVDHSTRPSGVELIALHGSLTLGRDSQVFEDKVEALILAQKQQIVLDLTDLAFLDSAGIGILVICHGKVLKAGGQLRLANLGARVLSVLRISKVDQMLFTDASVADSLRVFGEA